MHIIEDFEDHVADVATNQAKFAAMNPRKIVSYIIVTMVHVDGSDADNFDSGTEDEKGVRVECEMEVDVCGPMQCRANMLKAVSDVIKEDAVAALLAEAANGL